MYVPDSDDYVPYFSDEGAEIDTERAEELKKAVDKVNAGLNALEKQL